MSVVIYAPGGGWGHLNRARTLSAQLSQGADRPVIMTDSPYGGLHQSINLAILSRMTRRDTLIVDVFPCGPIGELIEMLDRCKVFKVLVARDIPH